MRRNYSRLASVEERKNLRKAFLYIILSIILGIFLIYFGLPLLAKFTGFVTQFKKTGLTADKNDTTPPAPPRFEIIPEAVNNETLEIKGFSEPGSTIIILFNGGESEVSPQLRGEFSKTLTLIKGKNTFSAYAKDASGNQSITSETFEIVFDNEAPKIEIFSPVDGTSFFGAKQRQITIKGKVDEEADVTINDRVVAVDDDNNFSYTTTLSEGENKFTVYTKDPAGNEAVEELSITFTP